MPLYRYIASASNSTTRRGELSADSAYQVRRALRQMMLVPIRVCEVPMRERQSWLGDRAHGTVARLLRRRRRGRLVEFYESLATLIATGTPVVTSLDTLSAESPRKRDPLITMCRRVAEALRGGSGLGIVLRDPAHASWFSPVDAALIEVAEQDGELERVMSDLAEYHARGARLGGKLVGALAYPGLLLVFGIGVVIFLTTTTLPPLAAVLADAGVPLPWPTKVLMGVGGLMSHAWLPMVVVTVALIVSGAYLLRSAPLSRARLRLPLVGRIIARGQTGEAALLIARLTRGGLPLTEALRLTSSTIPNTALRAGFLSLTDEFKAGRDGAEHMVRCGVFEPVFCRVMTVGQASGELASALETIGERLQSSAHRLTDRLAAILEPTVILLLAAMIGFVVYAAITPMLRMSQTIS